MSKCWAQVGEQGVLLTIVELIGRGFKPYRPVVDDHGVDLMLSDGTRVQVKSANLSTVWDRNGKSDNKKAYQFSLQKKSNQTEMRAGGLSYDYRDISKDVDFLILVGLDEHRFWVVPSAAVADCRHICIAPNPAYHKVGPTFRFNKVVYAGEDRWDILSGHQAAIDDSPTMYLPTIYERDPDFSATFASSEILQ